MYFYHLYTTRDNPYAPLIRSIFFFCGRKCRVDEVAQRSAARCEPVVEERSSSLAHRAVGGGGLEYYSGAEVRAQALRESYGVVQLD